MSTGRRLVTTVHVHRSDGTAKVYGPSDEVPAEDAKRITNPAVWSDGDADTAEPSDAEGGDIPPKGGPGSSRDAWAAYAQANGVDVDSDAKQGEIIAACDAAGVPTEA